MKQLTYSRMAAARIKANRRQYLSLVIGVFLSIFLISTLVFSVWGIYQANLEKRLNTIGDVDIVILDNEKADIVTEEAVLETGKYERLGHTYISGVVTSRNVYVGYYDEVGAALLNLSAKEGRLPEKPGEIAMEQSAMEILDVSWNIGDTVSLGITPIDGTEETREFILVGLLPERSMHLERIDYNGIGQFPAIVTCADEKPFETGRIAYHYLLDIVPTGSVSDSINAFWTKFKGQQVGAAIFGLSITGEQVWWTGTGDFIDTNKEMLSPMLLACILAGSLTLSCCVAISGAMDGVLSKRREEIGVLRALGATKRQIRKMFGQENLIFALVLSPLSILFSLGAVWLLSKLIPENLKFAVNLWLMLPIALFSVVVILLSGYLPLARASNQMPVSVIQDSRTLKRTKNLKSKKEFSTAILMASRQVRLNPTRQVGSALLVALMLFCSGLLGAVVYTFRGEYAYQKNLGFYISSDYGGTSLDWVNRYDKDPIDVEAIAELKSLEHVKQIHVNREMDILAEVDTVPRYAVGDVTKNNLGMLDDAMFREFMELRPDQIEAYEPDWQEERNEYFKLKDRYGFTGEAYQTSIMTIDLSDENVDILQDCLVEGNINVDAIHAGEQVLILAPEVWMKYYGNGSSTWFTPDDPFFEEYKADGAVLAAWNNCFTAGQTLPLTQLYSEEDTYSTITRNDAEVQVCGVLNSLGGLDYHNWNFCVIITTEQGLKNMGMRMEGLRRIELYVDDELTSEDEELLERQINAIARRFESYYVQNQMQRNREHVQAHRQELAVLLSVAILFFAVAVTMIVSSVTRQLNSERRTIGLLRAVGADEKMIFACYSRQMSIAVLGGLALIFVAGSIFIGCCWIDALISNLRFWYWEVAALVIIVVVTAAAVSALCWLFCYGILKQRIREIIKISIIDNIREA